MRARSHRYPDLDRYNDTTYYDEDDECLDLGYQLLRKINIGSYPEFTYLKKLFIDHNKLSSLPDAHYVPNLEHLTCSYNCLTQIPCYPKLTFLNIAGNQIHDCKQYHNSNLKYFDCSFNENFVMNIFLPRCRDLYINDVKLKSIDLELLPMLQVLDCSNNELFEINGGQNLVELNVQSNHLIQLPFMNNLIRLMADHNEIITMRTYPNLLSANVTRNNLIRIHDQPRLKKLIAYNNKINQLGHMPFIELIDLGHNNLDKIIIPNHAEYVSIQFNPISDLVLNTNVLSSIKELQVNFETYKHIYQKYYSYFEAINVQTNEEQLEKLLKKLSNVFNDSVARYVFRKFNNIRFREREDHLFKITLKIYWLYFPITNVKTLKELIHSNEFQHLLINMTNFYYKTIVITLYFNGYRN